MPRILTVTKGDRSARRRRAGFTALALLVTASLVACGGQSAAASAPSPAQATAATASATPLMAADDVPSLLPGAPVPALSLTLQDGFQLSLTQLKGKLITIFFCSDASQPECLREARGLGDRYEQLHEQHHVAIMGVTRQDAAAQRAFLAQHKLPYDLAADVDGRIAQAFGIPDYGSHAPRTFLIGKDGKVQTVWRSADPDEHARQILAAAGE